QIPNQFPPLPNSCVHFNDKKHSIPVCFKVKMKQKVWVAAQKIKKNILMQPSDFKIKIRNIVGLKYKPVLRIVPQLWLNKTLNQNTILTEEYLKPIPQVIKGQSVHLKISSKSIVISTEAIALEDGYQGQIIAMNNPQTNAGFHAKVIAPNQVEVLA
ncbi:MAG: flagellar basal body P-ring formation chaperone FlgA, partial [bacterium]|nr:flagellar basal body P-ring formation chaperone FlgA [bacterium]